MLELQNVSFQVDAEGAEKEIVRDIRDPTAEGNPRWPG